MPIGVGVVWTPLPGLSLVVEGGAGVWQEYEVLNERGIKRGEDETDPAPFVGVRLEYRFSGSMVPDAPDYVNLNSGIMIHAQPPQSLLLDQGFPSSLEMQFLADEGKGERSTANLCTPGTNIELGGKLVTSHIIKSTAPTFAPETWVKAEVEVHGNDDVIHRINGVEVLRYQRPQLDPRDDNAPASELLKAGSPLLLSYGHIALQAEGQPVWFRKIELKPLEKK